MLAKVTFVKIALHYIVLFGRSEPQLAAAKAVAFIIEKLIERHYHVIAGKIRCDMVRIRYANVRRRVGGDVGYNVVVYLAVIGIKSYVHLYIGI